MQGTPSNISGLSLKPLGSGDLIDRAVRFYRKYFSTFLAIGAPPVLFGTVLLIIWNFTASLIFNVDYTRPDEATAYRLFVGLGAFIIWFCQLIAVLAVMGGASRNFVRHILFNEPITFRETYRNTRQRLPGLLLVSLFMSGIIFIAALAIFYGWLMLTVIVFLFAGVIGSIVQIVGVIVSVVAIIAVSLGALWLFFAVLSRFVYIPQAMLVEGRSVTSAIGRSLALAGRNVTRVGSLFMFTIISTYVVMFLLYMPLLIFAWTQGISIGGFNGVEAAPAWFEIAGQVLNQASLILMFPVLVIGLCLLYVDERVRKEGYDLELMAARTLGEIPDVPDKFVNPLQPALSDSNRAPSKQSATNSTLGING